MNNEITKTHLSLDKNSDINIIDRVLSGEKELYERIMRKYNERLFRISRSYVKDEDEAEDVLQEAYILAYEKLPHFRKQSKFSTWLTRIVINEALARVKRQRRCVSVNPQSGDSEDGLVYPLTQSDMRTPEQDVINDELQHVLEKAIDRLPGKYRTVYVMRELEGMTVAETGECLNISTSNVKVRLNRAKEMLRANIGFFYDDVEVFEFHLVRCERIVANVLGYLQAY